jgi:hypothetical protein
MTNSANQTIERIPTSHWVTECPNTDASPFLKLALLLIVVFCAGSRFLGSPASTESMLAVAGLGLLYAIGVVALTIRTYRQS